MVLLVVLLVELLLLAETVVGCGCGYRKVEETRMDTAAGVAAGVAAAEATAVVAGAVVASGHCSG